MEVFAMLALVAIGVLVGYAIKAKSSAKGGDRAEPGRNDPH